MFSVVIPAHDEESVIVETLTTLLADAQDGEFEVVVVCNGCRDRTAELARSFGSSVRVVEIPEAAKWQALNAGDAAVRAFPRLYLDADVQVRARDVRALGDALREDAWLAAGPTPTFDLERCSPLVRAVYAVYTRLPVVQESLIGAGAYALSREGRGRFDEFIAVASDDLLVSCHFGSGRFGVREMGKVAEARSIVRPPRTLRDLVATKTRAYVGATHLQRLGYRLPTRRSTGWIHVLRRRPRLLGVLPVYAVAVGLARWRARGRLRAGDMLAWDRDDRSRAPA